MTAALAAAVATAACGSQHQAASSTPATAAARACTADDVKVAGSAGQKPTITVPADCAPPATLLVKDLTTGTGPAVAVGDHLEANYDLVTWSDHKEVDSSWRDGTGTPFAIDNIGHAQLIQGWNEGLLGERQGGRRLLVVPPAKGYPNGAGPIKPGETLLFVVDVTKVGS